MVLGLYHQPYKNGMGVVICLAGIPVYWVLVLWKNKPKVYHNTVGKFHSLTKKIIISMQDKWFPPTRSNTSVTTDVNISGIQVSQFKM